jgi:hypothetical protein
LLASFAFRANVIANILAMSTDLSNASTRPQQVADDRNAGFGVADQWIKPYIGRAGLDPNRQGESRMEPETTRATFQRGWDAALQAARDWHLSQAKQALVQSRRTRFPKTLERDAEVHRAAAEVILTLRPDDV